MKKRIILPTLLLTGALAVGALGITNVNAEDSNYSNIVQKIATRFNLNASDVQDVFDEVHQERQAEMEARFTQRLEDMVVDGKITSAQKQLILDKREEMLAKMNDWKDLSPEERKTKMDAFREELKTWADSQGFDFPLPMMGGIREFGPGPDGPRNGFGPKPE